MCLSLAATLAATLASTTAFKDTSPLLMYSTFSYVHLVLELMATAPKTIIRGE